MKFQRESAGRHIDQPESRGELSQPDQLWKVLKLPPRNSTRSAARGLTSVSSEGKFSKKLRSARRRVAAGPSGMTVEHLQPLLDHPSALHSTFLLGERLARADVLPSIVDTVRQEDSGLPEAEWRVEGHGRWRCDPHSCSTIGSSSGRQQHPSNALSTKAGCECVLNENKRFGPEVRTGQHN